MEDITEKKIKDFQKLLVINRIEILHILYEADTCVCQLVKQLNLKHNLISHHLKTLQDMGYIQSKRYGQHIVYNLKESKRDTVGSLFKILNFKY